MKRQRILRVEDELWDALKELAWRNRMDVTAQVTELIRDAVVTVVTSKKVTKNHGGRDGIDGRGEASEAQGEAG